MRTCLLFFLLFITHFGNGQSWEQRADVPSLGRDDGVAFSICGKGYVVTGNQDVFAESNRLWCYDPQSNSWTEKALFPGQARQYAGSFVLDNLGYLMCGYSSTSQALKDVWQYNPTTDSWLQLNDFEGAARWTFFQFTANGFGYVGAGAVPDSSVADCWKYDPNEDDWARMSDYPAGRMREVVGVSMGNHCFAGSGLNVNPLTFSKAFYEYHWETDTWTQIADYPTGEISYLGAQGVGLSAVMGGGWGEGNTFRTSFFKLSLEGNWTEAASAPIQGWRGMSTFSFDKTIYFVNGLYADLTRTSNLFSLEVEPDFYPILFPNPSDEKGKVYYKPNSEIVIYNHTGDEVLRDKTDFDGYFVLPEVNSGPYFIRFPEEGKRIKELRWLVR